MQKYLNTLQLTREGNTVSKPTTGVGKSKITLSGATKQELRGTGAFDKDDNMADRKGKEKRKAVEAEAGSRDIIPPRNKKSTGKSSTMNSTRRTLDSANVKQNLARTQRGALTPAARFRRTATTTHSPTSLSPSPTTQPSLSNLPSTNTRKRKSFKSKAQTATPPPLPKRSRTSPLPTQQHITGSRRATRSRGLSDRAELPWGWKNKGALLGNVEEQRRVQSEERLAAQRPERAFADRINDINIKPMKAEGPAESNGECLIERDGDEGGNAKVKKTEGEDTEVRSSSIRSLDREETTNEERVGKEPSSKPERRGREGSGAENEMRQGDRLGLSKIIKDQTLELQQESLSRAHSQSNEAEERAEPEIDVQVRPESTSEAQYIVATETTRSLTFPDSPSLYNESAAPTLNAERLSTTPNEQIHEAEQEKAAGVARDEQEAGKREDRESTDRTTRVQHVSTTPDQRDEVHSEPDLTPPFALDTNEDESNDTPYFPTLLTTVLDSDTSIPASQPPLANESKYTSPLAIPLPRVHSHSAPEPFTFGPAQTVWEVPGYTEKPAALTSPAWSTLPPLPRSPPPVAKISHKRTKEPAEKKPAPPRELDPALLSREGWILPERDLQIGENGRPPVWAIVGFSKLGSRPGLANSLIRT